MLYVGDFKKTGKVLFRNLINNLFNQIQLASNNAKTLNHKHKETLTACRGNY